MSGHFATVEWDGYDGPTYSFTCEEPPEAPCRAEWDCDCESYCNPGVDEHGPFHELTDGHMTNEQLDALRDNGTRPRHYGKHGAAACGQLVFITDSGEAGWMGAGSVRFPIDLDWSDDDESYLWCAS